MKAVHTSGLACLSAVRFAIFF